jgi:cell division protein FtsB
LKEGLGAVEERARSELGMIKQNEIFVQVLRKDEKPAVMMTQPPPAASMQRQPAKDKPAAAAARTRPRQRPPED